MLLLFPSDSLQPGRVDPDFERERNAARDAGFTSALIDIDALSSGEAARAVRWIERSDEQRTAIYRGWMLRPAAYAALYDALRRRDVLLADSPETYVTAHHLPRAYPYLQGRTPKSVWLEEAGGFDDARIAQALATFDSSPVIVKDYVKSQKHYWREACFIPDASNTPHALGVVRRFIELQDGKPEGGLVFRAFVPLASAGVHPKSGMPLSREWRLFIFDGEPVACAGYWKSDEAPPPTIINEFCALARGVPTRFLSMDLALTQAGEWIVVEIGSGQVSGLPEALEPERFYAALAGRIAGAVEPSSGARPAS